MLDLGFISIRVDFILIIKKKQGVWHQGGNFRNSGLSTSKQSEQRLNVTRDRLRAYRNYFRMALMDISKEDVKIKEDLGKSIETKILKKL